jgi:hypothetical protein
VARLVDLIIPDGADPDRLAGSLVRHDLGLLEGATGVALALHATTTGTWPASGWDACLLIT